MNNCKNCHIETANKKFCSRSCSASVNNEGVQRNFPKERFCVKCKSSFYNSKSHISRFCELCLNERKSKKVNEFTTLMELSERARNAGVHRSWWYTEVRTTNRRWNNHLIKECRKCKYSLHVELCHIKPISDFPQTATLGEINHESNIVGLCRNHHWEFDHGHLVL